VTFHLGYPPRGAYDIYARLIARLVDGEALQAMVERMFRAPRNVVEAARRAIGQK
jgi:hypothetical protein